VISIFASEGFNRWIGLKINTETPLYAQIGGIMVGMGRILSRFAPKTENIFSVKLKMEK